MENENKITKVLIIEDDEIERFSLKASLEAEGITVEAVETGAEAESIVKDIFFDVLIVDYRLPDIDGLNLIKKLKMTSPDLMPIVVTAHSSVEIAVEAMRMGAYDYMTKPLNVPVLIKTITKILSDKEIFIKSKKKLSQMVANNNINYAYNDENIVIICTPDTDVLLDKKSKIDLFSIIKSFFKTIKNYYWGS